MLLVRCTLPARGWGRSSEDVASRQRWLRKGLLAHTLVLRLLRPPRVERLSPSLHGVPDPFLDSGSEFSRFAQFGAEYTHAGQRFGTTLRGHLRTLGQFP